MTSSTFVSLPEILMAKLLLHCRERGLSVEQCIEKWLEDGSSGCVESKSSDVAPQKLSTPRKVPVKRTEVMKKAIELAKAVPAGEDFSLGTLLGKERWSLPSPEAFGRVFKKELDRLGIAVHKGHDHSYKVANFRRL